MTEPAETLYKVTGPGCEAVSGGAGVWHRPSGARPGKWMPEIASPVLCERGYHLVTADQLVEWLGPRVWVAEFHPAAVVVDGGDKLVGSRARLAALPDPCERYEAALRIIVEADLDVYGIEGYAMLANLTANLALQGDGMTDGEEEDPPGHCAGPLAHPHEPTIVAAGGTCPECGTVMFSEMPPPPACACGFPDRHTNLPCSRGAEGAGDGM